MLRHGTLASWHMRSKDTPKKRKQGSRNSGLRDITQVNYAFTH